jgi:hypothetical protein
MRIAVLTLVVVLLGACAPVPMRYWEPSAEGAEVVSSSCIDEPPYGASVKVGVARATVFLMDRSILVTFYSRIEPSIGFDPTLVAVTADGQSLALSGFTYSVGLTRPAAKHSAGGLTNVASQYVVFEATVPTKPIGSVRIYLPSVLIDGENFALPAVNFRKVSHAKLVPLIANC